jgi:hypothetical protein
MIHRGEIPPIDCAIFADTQEESGATYAHLKWLIAEVSGSFPVHVVTKSKLGDDLQRGENSDGYRFASIPAFTHSGDANEAAGITRRQCTSEYKLEPIALFIRSNILGLKPRQRRPKNKTVAQIFGLSLDEPGRVARVRLSVIDEGNVPLFPLFAKGMTRRDCVKWLDAYPVPHTVPRSACVFCPYKSNAEWQDLKTNDADGWKRALEIDETLRIPGLIVNRKLEHKLYLHRSCKPLADVDLRTKDERTGQRTLAFSDECQGMCGL